MSNIFSSAGIIPLTADEEIVKNEMDIPNSVKIIESGAFYNCPELKEVDMLSQFAKKGKTIFCKELIQNQDGRYVLKPINDANERIFLEGGLPF